MSVSNKPFLTTTAVLLTAVAGATFSVNPAVADRLGIEPSAYTKSQAPVRVWLTVTNGYMTLNWETTLTPGPSDFVALYNGDPKKLGPYRHLPGNSWKLAKDGSPHVTQYRVGPGYAIAYIQVFHDGSRQILATYP